jgi:hypothetical protein
MDSRTLANLRRKRLYIHKQLDRLEPAVARLRESLAEANSAIQASLTGTEPPATSAQAQSKLLARGTAPAARREIMREAGEPLAVLDIAVKALARKGVALPGPGTMKRTRTRVQQIFADWGKAGKVRTVGRKRNTRRVLTNTFTDH